MGVVIYNMQDAGYTQIAAALSTLVLLVILAGNAVVRKLSKGEISI
jgi:iron(III) transport system permease protein